MRGLEKSVERAQRTVIRLALGGIIGIIALIAAFWGGHDIYVRWQERRLIQRASYALDHGDLRNASLAARNVLRLKPSSVGAARIVAELGERSGDRGALDWRRKVAELQPQSLEDTLAWAKSALLFNNLALTEKILGQVSEAGQQTPGYHAVSALLAQSRQQDEKSQKEWGEAVRLAPNEKAYQLQLGISLLRASDQDRRTSGVAMLSTLRQEKRQRVLATRALLNDGISRHENAGQLLELARQLQEYPEATLADRLLYLDFLHQLNDPRFTSYLTELQKESAQNPSALAEVLSWMSARSMNLLALDFVKSLPPEMRETWPVPLARADIYLHLKDWDQLVSVTKEPNWKHEILRHAFLTYALRAQDKPAEAEHEWATALKKASNDASTLASLLSLVSQWRWEAEMVDVLWALSKHPEKQNEAYATLYRYYAKNGDTQGLYKVLVRLADVDPSNLDVQNNLAQVSLLLNATPEEARRNAAEIYHKAPSNPAYAATYAYSLLTKGDPQGAVEIIGLLPENQLRDPAISAYYGIFLAAVKDERAREFLEAGRKAPLLPEEKTLIDKALANVQAHGR